MTVQFHRRAAIAAAAFALLLPGAHADDAKPRVGLVMKSLANEFFKNMTEGAIAHEKKRGDFTLKAVITVINFDVALEPAALKKAGLDVAFVGPDNRAGAKLAGDELAKAVGPGAKVVIIEGNPGADNALQRKLGFEDAAKAGKL